MGMEVLEIALGPDYAEWCAWEAIREIVQNYLDAEDGGSCSNFGYDSSEEYWIDGVPRRGCLWFRNEGVKIERRSLILGGTDKAGDSKSRGRWGEGMKLAWSTLHRLGMRVEMIANDERWMPRIGYSQSFGADILHVDVHPHDGDGSIEVRLIGVDEGLWGEVCQKILSLLDLEDSEFINGYGGRLLLSDRFKGNLYVKGIFVCKLKGVWNYGYDLDDVILDRDRKIPNSYSLHPKICHLIKSLVEDGKMDPEDVMAVLESGDFEDGKLFADAYNDDHLGEFHREIADSFSKMYGPDAVPVLAADDVHSLRSKGLRGVVVSNVVRRVVMIGRGESNNCNWGDYDNECLLSEPVDLSNACDVGCRMLLTMITNLILVTRFSDKFSSFVPVRFPVGRKNEKVFCIDGVIGISSDFLKESSGDVFVMVMREFAAFLYFELPGYNDSDEVFNAMISDVINSDLFNSV